MKAILRLSASMLSAALLTASAMAFGQAYPSKPVTLIVPFPAGGTSDILARVVAQKLSEKWGQQVIIDNRSGAGGTLGATIAAKAAPDGYTMFVGTAHHTIAPSVYKKLSYNFEKDFAPITVIAFVPNILIVNPQVPVKNVTVLIALAKAQPGKLTYASGGSGTSEHLAGELFKTMAKTDIVHVPYKGGAPAMTDLIGGQTQIYFGTGSSVSAQIRGGKVRPLAVTTAKRSPLFPDIPTMAEAGLPGYEVTTWYGIVVPAATPKEIQRKLYNDIATVLKTPEVQDKLKQQTADTGGITPQEFGQLIKTETVKWAKVVKESGVTVE